MKRFTLILIGVFLASIFVFSQQKQITLHLNNVTVKEALEALKKTGGYTYWFDAKDLDITQKVSINVVNKNIDDVLVLLFKGQKVDYTIKNGSIVIRKSEVKNTLVQKKTELKKVNGVVVDEKGVPVIGATVMLPGTKVGVITDVNGQFSIEAPSEAKIRISYIGYAAKEEEIKNTSFMKISLSDIDVKLNEIVAIGYGTSKKGDLSGAVSVIKGVQLTKNPVSSFDQALAGKIAGVQISSNEGQPGQQTNIIIRGVGSLTQDFSPLYVIDGFPVEDNFNDAINPEDIESINVLKDASATAIYGARGSNGVIIIETKKGKQGQSEINFGASYGFQEVIKTIDLMNPYEFVKYQLERNPTYASAEYLDITNGITLDTYKNKPQINWQDEAFRRAPVQEYNIAFRGGTNNMKYSLSGSYFDQDGIIINSGYKKYQGRLYFEQDFNQKIRIGATANYSNVESYGQEASSYGTTGNSSTYLLYSVWGYRPTGGLKTSDDLLIGEQFDPEQDYSGQNYIINPVFSAKNEYNSKTYNTLMLNSFINYKINRYLSIRSTLNYSSLNLTREVFNNSSSRLGNPMFPSNIHGVNGSWINSETANFVNENTLRYSRTIKKYHRFDLTIGSTYSKRRVERFGFATQQIPNENLVMSGLDEGIPYESYSSITGWGLASYLMRLNYILRDKYIFTGTFRADGSSKFASINRWGYFPSGAFAWRMSEENFLKGIDALSNAKLRISYGETGNNRVSDFDYLSQMAYTSISSYSFNNNTPNKGIVPIVVANKDLTWETTNQFNVGYDLGFLNNKIELVIDYYNKITRNLQLYANLPYYTGFANAYRNIGKIQNNGLEFSINTVNFDTKDFTWTTNFNISLNSNKVLGLADDEEYLLSNVGWGVDYNYTPLYIAQLGKPAAQFYGYKWDGNYQYADFNELSNGVYALKDDVTTNGMARDKIKPGDIKYCDLNGDKVVDSNDLTVLGDAYPIHTGGFTNELRYKNLTLNLSLQWSYGNKIMNANRIIFEGNGLLRQNLNQYATYINRWTPENPNNVYFGTGGQGPIGVYSDRTLEDGSYIRLKSMSLSYTIPEKMIKSLKIKTLSLSFSSQNLFTLTNYTGMDPEVSVRNSALTPGLDYSAYPRAKNFIFGIKASF